MLIAQSGVPETRPPSPFFYPAMAPPASCVGGLRVGMRGFGNAARTGHHPLGLQRRLALSRHYRLRGGHRFHRWIEAGWHASGDDLNCHRADIFSLASLCFPAPLNLLFFWCTMPGATVNWAKLVTNVDGSPALVPLSCPSRGWWCAHQPG